jgi:hypothetical protein
MGVYVWRQLSMNSPKRSDRTPTAKRDEPRPWIDQRNSAFCTVCLCASREPEREGRLHRNGESPGHVVVVRSPNRYGIPPALELLDRPLFGSLISGPVRLLGVSVVELWLPNTILQRTEGHSSKLVAVALRGDLGRAGNLRGEAIVIEVRHDDCTIPVCFQIHVA